MKLVLAEHLMQVMTEKAERTQWIFLTSPLDLQTFHISHGLYMC